MRTLAFDGRTGATGEALLGSLLSAGADGGSLAPTAESLDVEFDVATVELDGVAATEVTVQPIGAGRNGEDRDDVRDDADIDDADRNGDPRTISDVLDRLASVDLPEAVETDVAAVFRLLAEGTASARGTDPDAVTLTGSGTDEALATVSGVALLVNDLDPDRVVTTPLAVGSGEVHTGEGVVPVPTPTVLEVAERADWTVRGGPAEGELLPPVGAALLAHFATGVETLPGIRVTTTGYGAGDGSSEGRGNALRAVVGEGDDPVTEPIAVLETTVDDVAPEVLGGLQETLKAAGARDVSVVPLTMKKSRPGHLVKAIVRPEDADRVARRLVAETGTLGVRRSGGEHYSLVRRSIESVTVEVGNEAYELGVKVATDDAGEPLDVSAEYDDALSVATATELPVREVLRLAETAYRS